LSDSSVIERAVKDKKKVSIPVVGTPPIKDRMTNKEIMTQYCWFLILETLLLHFSQDQFTQIALKLWLLLTTRTKVITTLQINWC